jgi:transcription initiation factor IIF auxiliary subunit
VEPEAEEASHEQLTQELHLEVHHMNTAAADLAATKSAMVASEKMMEMAAAYKHEKVEDDYATPLQIEGDMQRYFLTAKQKALEGHVDRVRRKSVNLLGRSPTLVGASLAAAMAHGPRG